MRHICGITYTELKAGNEREGTVSEVPNIFI